MGQTFFRIVGFLCGRTLSLGLNCANETFCERLFFLRLQQARLACQEILLSVLEILSRSRKDDVIRSIHIYPPVLRSFFCDFSAGTALCTRPPISNGPGLHILDHIVTSWPTGHR